MAKKTRERKDTCLQDALQKWLRRPVPHFVRKYKGRWAHYLVRWLKRNGYECVIHLRDARGQVLFLHTPRMYIQIGEARGDRRTHHAVLVKDNRYFYEGANPLSKIVGTIHIWKKKGRV